jgi:hypothetical protein
VQIGTFGEPLLRQPGREAMPSDDLTEGGRQQVHAVDAGSPHTKGGKFSLGDRIGFFRLAPPLLTRLNIDHKMRLPRRGRNRSAAARHRTQPKKEWPMDPTRFDALVRSLGTVASRRALAGLLAALAAPLLPGSASADRKRGKARGKRRGRRIRAEAVPASCCGGGNCTPGPGKNLQKCCYEGQNLAGANFKGSNLGSANFSGATLTNADFRSANLDKACFVDANLTGAKLAGANTGTAIFCRTTMPDGLVNNSGCDKGTECCPTCDAARPCPADQVCCGGRCRRGDCCTDAQCPSGLCCARVCCAEGQVCRDGTCADSVCPPGGDACGSAQSVTRCSATVPGCYCGTTIEGDPFCIGVATQCGAACSPTNPCLTPGEECVATPTCCNAGGGTCFPTCSTGR